MRSLVRKTGPALLTASLLSLLGQSACEGVQPRLVVAVAASLGQITPQLERHFEGDFPGWDLQVTTAGSGTLAAQIRGGMPADVFISASEDWTMRLQQDGLLTQKKPSRIAGNTLVLVGPSGGVALSFADLLNNPALKLAIGEPASVPAGTYAKQLLSDLALWKTLLSRGQLVYTGDVRQALLYAEQGEVDGALVYQTDLLPERRVRVHQEIRGDMAPEIYYSMAALKRSEHILQAQWVLDYFISGPGAKSLRDAGFVGLEMTERSAQHAPPKEGKQ